MLLGYRGQLLVISYTVCAIISYGITKFLLRITRTSIEMGTSGSQRILSDFMLLYGWLESIHVLHSTKEEHFVMLFCHIM